MKMSERKWRITARFDVDRWYDAVELLKKFKEIRVDFDVKTSFSLDEVQSLSGKAKDHE